MSPYVKSLSVSAEVEEQLSRFDLFQQPLNVLAPVCSSTTSMPDQTLVRDPVVVLMAKRRELFWLVLQSR